MSSKSQWVYLMLWLGITVVTDISLEVAARLIRVGRRSVRRWQAAYRAQSADALAADRCWRAAWGFAVTRSPLTRYAAVGLLPIGARVRIAQTHISELRCARHAAVFERASHDAALRSLLPPWRSKRAIGVCLGLTLSSLRSVPVPYPSAQREQGSVSNGDTISPSTGRKDRFGSVEKCPRIDTRGSILLMNPDDKGV